ncbi:Uncharacterized protein C2A9.02 [Hypsizygus marmoreus]|uniref:Uncharacterized protein C2A9.02 n=1 Tax=Hypsizygus marmoreus TaxID=39966 RepID=A0A369JFW4_HYPMA|nr:Uncharacterized protein C2A9.02 [Hypsizygus marmoreus]
MAKSNILLTGATGYLGGSVLIRLLNHPDIASVNITALVRSPEKAEKLKPLGVNAVLGSHSDLALLEKLASESDVVIAMADADNIDAARAILKGLKKRFEVTGQSPIYIHTSGTGVLADNAAGDHAYDIIYDDTNADQIETLAPTQIHRNVDLELVNADKEGYVRTFIILPSTVYGIVTGKLVDLGIQHPYSLQVPAVIDASVRRGQGGMVGAGKNLWPNVHIDDIADLYVTLLNAIHTKNPAATHGREGYYFGENGEHSMYQIGAAVAQALVDIGKGKSAEPTSFTQDEINLYFGGSPFLGVNSRCKGNRSRAIGWNPVKTTADLLASIKPDLEASFHRKSVLAG